MENISKLTGIQFKVLNTWKLLDTWKTGGNELYIQKILSTLKTTIKESYDLGRVTKMYFEQGEYNGKTVSYFHYETKNGKVSVILRKGLNLNHGTWFTIEQINLCNPKL
jgi:hypothetical protein